MNAVETLGAAIHKLETLKAAGTEGEWWMNPIERGEVFIEGDPAAGEYPLAEVHEHADAELIVTLHRTIDAQLAILRAALDDFERYGSKPSKFFENDLALADAILGGESNG